MIFFMEDVEQDGGIDENEGELLRNALEFRDLTAAEIMTAPLFVYQHTKIRDILKTFQKPRSGSG